MTRTLSVALSMLALVVAIDPTVSSAATMQASASATEAEFDRFAPARQTTNTRLDWSFYDKALDWFVLYMGPSLRKSAPRIQPIIGTRVRYGHESRYRMEGNRVAFEYIEEDELSALAEYRRGLEQIGTELNLSTLPRNEQLSYWLNLHNVAMIEQIARAYPVGEPRDIRIDGVPLDEARFITVDGVAMSPQDIRTKIVYPNWRDPRVIYGFFRGEIGGPSIQEMAFTGRNVDMLLDVAADEFVNSLRGTQARGDSLHVSTIYDEARGFYFRQWPTDLRTHLLALAEGDVGEMVGRTDAIEADIREHDIADLSNGEKARAWSFACTRGYDPATGNQGKGLDDNVGVSVNCTYQNSYIPKLVRDFSAERLQKVKRLIREDRYGRVYLFDETGEPLEVE
ncbi:DUF547 domain-containing protein [Alteriqipengyuania sp. 357]